MTATQSPTEHASTERSSPAEDVDESPPQTRGWWLRAGMTVVLCSAALIGASVVFEWLASFKTEPPRQDQAGIVKTYNVSVYQVQPVDLQRVITAFGTALADREVVVAAEVAGQVVEANQLEVGHAVKPAGTTRSPAGTTLTVDGDVLVRIDPQIYEERVLQAKKLLAQDDIELQKLLQEHANDKRLLETEKSNVATSKKEYDSAVRMRDQNVGTESAVRQAELDLRRYEDAVIRLENELNLFDIRKQAALSRKDAHQSDLELAQLDLNRTVVKPPFAGVISEVHVEQGQYVRPGDPLVRLTDPDRVEVPVSLTLSDYLAIASMREAGDQIRVVMAENETAQPRWFSDPLDELRQAPEANERTRTVKVYTEVDNRAQEVPLLPGTFVHARIAGPVLPQAIVVPRDAVVEGTVFVAVPEPTEESATADATAWFATVERRPVTTGRTMQSLVQIETGVNAGDWIVTTNLDVVHDGARLKIDRSEGERSLTDELATLRTPQVQVVE